MLGLNGVSKGWIFGCQYTGAVGLTIIMLLGSGCKSSSPATPKKEASLVAIGVMDTQWLLQHSKLGKQVTDCLLYTSPSPRD